MVKKLAGKNKKMSWKREFADLVEDSFFYLKENKKYVYASALIFFASSIFGYVYSARLGFFDKLIEEIVKSTRDLDYLEMIWFIFSNNVTSSLSALFLGAFFGIFPLFNALFNGSILGYVYSKASSIAGYLVIWQLIPHGIFELPAIFISLGLGIHLGFSFFASKDKINTFRFRFKESFKVFLVIVVPLLALAAIIESSLIFFMG
ncbi:stage II sporulation protein M [Candidatus Pacearchaeota archaeon]|nr:stage II sporulation protein M [Candidatus Pacearchaeota archaeon]